MTLDAFSVRLLSQGRESRMLLLPCYPQREARLATVVAVAVAPGRAHVDLERLGLSVLLLSRGREPRMLVQRGDA